MKAFLSALLAITLPALSLAQSRPCPPCYRNFLADTAAIRPDGTMRLSTDGRPVITIRIDGSWDQSPGDTNHNVWNAAAGCPQCSPPVVGALEMWNETVDANGEKIPYKLELDQGDADAAIVIVKGDAASSGFATIDMSHRPYVMTLDPRNATIDLQSVRGRVAHEIGHPLGLAQAMANCGSNTLMSDGNLTPSGALFYTKVTSNDIAQVRRQRFNNGDCTVTFSGSPQGLECHDDDSDGVTTCDGDCNDGDPSFAFNCCDPESAGECSCTAEQLSYKPTCVENGMVWIPEFCACGNTPILLDTAGDGFRLTSARGGVAFDLNGDGTREQVAWTGDEGDDAWLALDRNGNGVIDDGRELFGDRAPQPFSESRNGFRALAEFDEPRAGGNSDGVIGSGDEVFTQLRLWQDTNHNGISEPDELHTLPAMGVRSISFDYKEVMRRDRYGNQFRYQAPVEGSDSRITRRLAYDVLLLPAR